jgi:hypothetical protein
MGPPALLPPKEGVLRNFIALKNPSPWPGSNLRPLGPVASTVTTTRSRRPVLIVLPFSSADYVSNGNRRELSSKHQEAYHLQHYHHVHHGINGIHTARVPSVPGVLAAAMLLYVFLGDEHRHKHVQ